MAFTSLMDPKQYASWEQDPSTRESVRLHTKAYPVDVTLAVAGTAEYLLEVSPGVATVNMITNPSMETGTPPTGYTAVSGAAITRQNTAYLYGSYSMRIVPPGVVAGEGAYWDLGAYPQDQPLTISAYFSDNAGGSDDARVELVAATTPFTGITNARIAIGNTVTFAGAGWYRSFVTKIEKQAIQVFRIQGASAAFDEDETVTGTTSGSTAVVRTVDETNNLWLVVDTVSAPFSPELQRGASETITGSGSGSTATLILVERAPLNMNTLQLHMVTASLHGTTFYVDGVQAEARHSVSPFCDGDQGLFHWWDGTAHASTSRRWRKLSSIRSYRLHAERDIYIAYDRVASRIATNACDKGEFVRAGTDFGEDHPIYLDSGVSIINVNAGELPRVYGVFWGV
jgi:hypothetical protein